MTIMAQVVETNDSEESLLSSGDEKDQPNDDNSKFNAGWADSVAKILKTNKPKGKKTLVLSQAKKLCDVKKQKTVPAGFQVATADGDIKEENIEIEDVKEEYEPHRKKKKELLNLRVKPNILEKDRERTLAKIATKGVIQLFNAVKMQQKDISKKLEEAGPLEVRKEKVLKSIDKKAFLDVLMGEKSQVVDNNISKTKDEGEKDKNINSESTWSVLRDDFMMGAKLKDWDKEIEEEKEVEQEVS